MNTANGRPRSALRIATVAGVLSIALVGVSPLAAQASKGTLVVDDDYSIAEETERWVDAYGYVRLPKHELEQLAATQSADEIEAVMASSEPVNALFDPKTGTFLAAVFAEKTSAIGPLAITTGCGYAGAAVSHRYVGSYGAATCFNGTGHLYISLPNTFWLSAGYYDTTWYTSSQGYYVPAFDTWTISGSINVVSVVR